MRKLPPFASIRAFEAAARLLSFKKAAVENAITPTAVSHQIRQLERLSGKSLFTRSARKVALTPAGKAFANELGPALDSISQAYHNLCATPNRMQVTLGAGPVIASRWLVPRLADFWQTHPDIDLWLHHSQLAVWQQIDSYDIAIAWGDGNWPGVIAERLISINVTPVYSKLMSNRVPRSNPKELLKLPLLHHRDDSGWRQWFDSEGVSVPEHLPGMVFEDANVLLQATLTGRGIALGILQFIQDDLSSGRLVRPFESSIDPGHAYFLIHRGKEIRDQPTLAVRDWLLRG